MNLTALQHSPFLQSLGWAIANSLWQAAVLWAIYHLINGLYKNASAKFRNNFSTILLLSAFLWFCITLFTKYFTLRSELDSFTQLQLYAPGKIISSYNSWTYFLSVVSASLPYLSASYLLLLVFFAIKLINSYRFIYFIRTTGLQKSPVELRLFTEKVARQIGIAKKIKLWVSQHIDVPATIGFIKPVILIPLASVNQLSAEQLEAIILHELSHIKRNDYLINILISLAETILFFNPFVVLLAKILKRERENCCDDFVIQYQYDPHSYASALLSLEQYRSMNLRLAMSATSGKKQLLRRIKRIMEIRSSGSNFNYGQKLLALLSVTGIICSIAWLSPDKKSENEHPPVVATALTTVSNPWKKLNISYQKNSSGIMAKQIAKKVASPVTTENIQLSQIQPDQQKEHEAIITRNEDINPRSSFLYDMPTTDEYTSAPDAFSYSQNFSAPKFSDEVRAETGRKSWQVYDFKKQGYEMDKTGFSFSFDGDKADKEIQEQLKNVQQSFGYGKLLDNRILKTTRPARSKEMEHARQQQVLQRIEVYSQKFSKALQEAYISSFKVDSLLHNSMVLKINRDVRNLPGQLFICPNFRTPGFKAPLPPATNRHTGNGQNQEEHGRLERKRANDEHKLIIQYANGVLIINGEKINLPENSNNIKILQAVKAKGMLFTENKTPDADWNN